MDWVAELAARAVTLVLPPVVLEELDKRKWAGTRRDKERAKTVLRTLKELALSTTPVQIRPGVSVVALDDEPDDAFLAQHVAAFRAQLDDSFGALVECETRRGAQPGVRLAEWVA